MCGINGIFAYGGASRPIDRRELIRSRDHMASRGPDGKGEWISLDGRVAFGHRRLSVIDLTDMGAQPMGTPDGRFIVTFNGEIYNYRELRRGLESKGYVFRSSSDTEVLLRLYDDKGDAMVHDLRGMFAFAIWDEQRRRLLVARDPYGIKPLYYSDDGRSLRFASQVKALLAGGGVDVTSDPAGLVSFYLLGSIAEPFTLYQQIKQLPAGHTISVDESGVGSPRRYHAISQVYAREEANARPPEGPARLIMARDALLDSVRRHLVSDVPVGAFLSAGIDSTALVGLMRDAGQSSIETITLAFKEFENLPEDEAPIAAEAALAYGTRHTTRLVTKDEFMNDLPKIIAAMDQPSIDGVNTWFVSKAARERGLKVAISGVGGDELLGGYPSFRTIPKWVGWTTAPAAVPGLGTLMRRAVTAIGTERLKVNPKAAGFVEYGGSYAGAWYLLRGLFMPWELPALLDPEVVREGLGRLNLHALTRAALDPMPRDRFARVASLEASLYMRNQLLRDTDWAGMAHSLEIRTPLVDATLLQRFARLGPPVPGAPLKQELALAPSKPLPPSVTQRKKTGFTVPFRAWLPWAEAKDRSVYGYARRWAQVLASQGAALPHRPLGAA